jgi:GAF domain-containing protein
MTTGEGTGGGGGDAVGAGGVRNEGWALTELSRISLGDQPLSATLTRVAELARESIPGTTAASVTLVERGSPRSVGLTGPLAAALDERQYETGFGPCLEAAVTGAPVVIEDTADEDVYRDFAALARRLGVTSVLSVGLPLDHRVVGSLNIYRTDGRLDERATELARDFARNAATVVDNAAEYAGATDLVGHLRIALQSRAVIEQAKGVLMERHRCSADEAFHRLAIQSQREGRKLRQVAAELVATVQPPSGRPAGEAGPPG